MKSILNNLTWKCDICGCTRPDQAISVYKIPIVIDGVELGQQNVKYCNDRADCTADVKKFSFLKGKNVNSRPPGEVDQ